MQGIIDILGSDIQENGQSDFLADSAEIDVQVNAPAGDGLQFQNPSGQYQFQLGDQLRIQKIWAVVPWGFGPGGQALSLFLHTINLQFYDGLTLSYVPPFPGPIAIPTLCTPLDFGDGIYCPMPTTGNNLQFRLTDIALRISQVNLPAALDGERIPVQYFLQVLHTLPMLAPS